MLQYNNSPNDFFISYSVHLCHGGYSLKKVPKTLCTSPKLQACSDQLSKLHCYRHSISSNPI